MNYYGVLINTIILVKLIFIILLIIHLYYKAKKEENSERDKKIVFWRERFEFMFIFLMASLLIYIFNPRTNRLNLITYETKLLLYLFGFLLLIRAKWSIFITESPIIVNI